MSAAVVCLRCGGGCEVTPCGNARGTGAELVCGCPATLARATLAHVTFRGPRCAACLLRWLRRAHPDRFAALEPCARGAPAR